jgi:site-specific recombinase XerD
MTESCIIDPRARGRASAGPLGPQVEAFAIQMRAQGYSAAYARERVRAVAELSWWLERQHVGRRELTEAHLTAFAARGWRPSRRPFDHLLLQRLLAAWRRAGIVATPAPDVHDDRTPIEHAFTQYLRDERGLTPATERNVLRIIRQFLAERFGRAPVAVSTLAASDLTGFVCRHIGPRSPGSAGTVVGALRSFVRFLVARGEVPAALRTCIPAVARWRDTTLPSALAPAEVARLLRTCRRHTATGRRDYALLLLLARLGLRAGEVAALTLDDCDWAAGTITIRGKGGREAQLPLPRDVGAALSTYLRRARPRCPSRHLFVTAYAPYAGISRVTVGMRVQVAVRAAGLAPAHRGAHLLRHTLATDLLRRGASLATIGKLLRHHRIDTTAIYAKVDLVALRALAHPWPGAGQ